MNNYIPVIGLEIHVELKTKSKMFCGCPADHFAKKPNSICCPVCLGLPGALPVPNKKAIEWTILLGKTLGCAINKVSKFDRKHYFYPDLPNGYQISQYDEPIATKGKLSLQIQSSKFKVQNDSSKLKNEEKTFRIHRVHLEEDTGKLIHKGNETLIDFNRSGVPLVEIVTEPDFDNADDVKRFLEELQVIVRYLGISDADMEKGSMRLEPNISVREIPNPKSQIPNISKLPITNYQLPKYKVEVKNINSFRFVKQAIEYEIERQTTLLEKGETPKQETRGFNSNKQITYSQRSKEEAHDYRYFPEPDIPPMIFNDDWLKQIEKQIPELPQAKLERFVKDYSLKFSDAFILTRDKKLSNYFEQVNSKFKIQNSKSKLKIKNYSQSIINLIINNKLSKTLTIGEFVNKVIELLAPKETDEKLLGATITRIIETNKKVVDDYKSGKQNAIMFLVGQVMREMKGKADAKIVINMLKSKIQSSNVRSSRFNRD